MTATSRASMLAAYQMVATHGGVNEADPHRLIVMLMDGALARIAQARGCMERKAPAAEKSVHLQRALAIVRAAAPFGNFNAAMRQQADQIVITSRFRFTRDDWVA